MLGGADPVEYAFAIESCLEDEFVDTVLVIHVPTSVVNPDEVAKAIGEAAKKVQKPVLACIMGDYSIGRARTILSEYQIPTYQYPEQIGPVADAMNIYRQIHAKPATGQIQKKSTTLIPLNKLVYNLSHSELGEAQIRPLLASYGIPIVQAEIAHTEQEAVEIISKMGVPAAMKIVSPDVLHKSDAGGIKLNVTGASEALTAYHEILDNINKIHPKAVIEGVIIEPMAPEGQEVIIGMKRDPQFGPLVMFGLGGIYVELFKDVSFRIAPFTREDAVQMVQETKAGLLLDGMRGHKAGDVEAVIECILKIAQISLDYPEIQEIEINPLLVFDNKHGAVALDGRAILK